MKAVIKISWFSCARSTRHCRKIYQGISSAFEGVIGRIIGLMPILAIAWFNPLHAEEPTERFDLLIQGASNRISSQRHTVLRYHGITGELLGPIVASGAGGLMDPHNPTMGPDENIYVSSGGTQSIKRYDGRTGEYIDDFVTAGSGGFDGTSKMAFGPAWQSLHGKFRSAPGAAVQW